MTALKSNRFVTRFFYGIKEGFFPALEKTLNETSARGVFCGDNLITFGRNLGFLSDPELYAAMRKNVTTQQEAACAWRIATLVWAARTVLNGVEGDFIECACYRGTTARVICDTLNFGSIDRRYFLYDLFEGSMPAHGADLYEQTLRRFADLQNVQIVKGRVPDSLSVGPDKIALLHLDLNDAMAETMALELLYPKIQKGGIIVLDDYGWLDYRDQKLAADAFFLEHNKHVLELPTGQGLVVK